MRSAINKYYSFGRGLKDEEAFINLLKNSKRLKLETHGMKCG